MLRGKGKPKPETSWKRKPLREGVRMHVSACVRMCLNVYACVCMCVHVCACICACVYARVLYMHGDELEGDMCVCGVALMADSVCIHVCVCAGFLLCLIQKPSRHAVAKELILPTSLLAYLLTYKAAML